MPFWRNKLEFKILCKNLKIMAARDAKTENDWDQEFLTTVPSFDVDQAIVKGAMTQIMEGFKKEAFEVTEKIFLYCTKCQVNL